MSNTVSLSVGGLLVGICLVRGRISNWCQCTTDMYHVTLVMVFYAVVTSSRLNTGATCSDNSCLLRHYLTIFAINWSRRSQQTATVVKLLNQRWWIPVFHRNSNIAGDIYIYVCISYRELYACICIITHSLKYYKSVKQKKCFSALGRMHRLDDLCLLFSTDMDPPDSQNPVLDSGGSQQKGAGSVYQGGGSQITGGGSESWGGGAEIRRDPPQFNPWTATCYCQDIWIIYIHHWIQICL